METIMLGLEITRRLASKIGPYVVVELLLPGGTLFALLFYWYRRQSGSKQFSRHIVDSVPARSTM
jgi:hypothetical protein